MLYLFLIRHAKSSWDNPFLKDFDRPLNERGKKNAPRMGQRLKELNIKPDFFMTSPAERALTTAKIIAKETGFDAKKILMLDELFHASSQTILKVTRGFEDHHKRIFLTGHNPGLTDYANFLTDHEVENIPTAGVFAIKFNLNSWKLVDKKKGECLFFEFPKGLGY